jgi:L-glyceraldehyde 3-phosphate reductase
MLNRWIETDLLAALGELGIGCIAFSPLAQGLLTSKYLAGRPSDSRAAKQGTFRPEYLTTQTVERARALNAIAARRGQSLAQMAIAWVLRDPRVTAALIGARSVEQLDESLDALEQLSFTAEELAEIDRYAVDSGINLWEASSSAEST